jgi:glycosyltransferase involved in cell wall biosynthesis
MPLHTHAVIIPTYNAGPMVYETVAAARAQWAPVWVVIDGSTDGTAEGLQRMAAGDPDLRVLPLPRNRGKGAAVLLGLHAAQAEGYTHALTMDSDGQHPAHLIPRFMQVSAEHPQAMVLGQPIFDSSAPRIRVLWRRLSNFWTDIETLGAGIGDSLFGFRVYPIAELIEVMQHQPWMRRFDFDAEAVVRLAWRGVAPLGLPAPVKYLLPEEGGVSHFRYLRDNLLLSWMHLRLMVEFLPRLPLLAWKRLTGAPPFQFCRQRR